MIAGGEKKGSARDGVQVNPGEYRFERSVDGACEEVTSLFKFAEAVDDEDTSGPQHAPNRSECLARQQMGW